MVSKPPAGSIRTVVYMEPIETAQGDEVLLVADGGRAAGRMESLLREVGLTVHLIDPWDDDGTAVHLGVRSLPTALLVRQGAVVARLTSTRRRAVDRFLATVRAPSIEGCVASRGVRCDRTSPYLRYLANAGRLPVSVAGPPRAAVATTAATAPAMSST